MRILEFPVQLTVQRSSTARDVQPSPPEELWHGHESEEDCQAAYCFDGRCVIPQLPRRSALKIRSEARLSLWQRRCTPTRQGL
ncbi:hypothetical protein SKAU_G00430120 [Synaphobranchus kaupii]|uniref:Uncharacterized protein n=1 Tax=Synaphobranchus kaupii TaxID=118154 RepID=A0A9Q1E4S3_SYNKA|nr:hypothetical protein SKAU_G00430120 [Synaphobranchus kaupii]